MRIRFNDRCANLADDLSDVEIDVLLNEQYIYAIPDDIPGSFSDGWWFEGTVSGTQQYDYASFVHSVRHGAFIDDDPIRMFFRPSEMWARYDLGSTEEKKPCAALFYEKKMTFSPTPDDRYMMSIPCRVYPNDGLSISTGLTDDGLDNNSHALAVISGAAAERLADSGDFEHASAELGRRAMYMKRLRIQSVLPPRGRRARRSF